MDEEINAYYVYWYYDTKGYGGVVLNLKNGDNVRLKSFNS